MEIVLRGLPSSARLYV
uniref:Uncharacterized protein n=1 Tax=Arundo donax TaxID=35708 RepID=A0A0A8YRX4_ARUDO